MLRLELGENRTLGPIRYEYLYAQGRLVAAARAHGLDAINTAYLSYKDLEGTRRDARFMAQMGFSGCIAITPRQAPVINEAFTPSDGDIAWAHSVVDDFEESVRDRERTVIVENDEMVDGPLVVNARRILERRHASDMKKATVGA